MLPLLQARSYKERCSTPAVQNLIPVLPRPRKGCVRTAYMGPVPPHRARQDGEGSAGPLPPHMARRKGEGGGGGGQRSEILKSLM